MKNLIGKTFGRLTVVSLSERNTSGNWRWLCKCLCGKHATPTTSGLNSGRSTSCGCYAKERFKTAPTKHGRYQSCEYQAWRNMKSRCDNPKHPSFINYGGRGISVCERWSTFELFDSDMGQRPEGLSLERVDNDEGYSPSNCIWATKSRQIANRRNTIKNVPCEFCKTMFKPTWQRNRVSRFCSHACYHNSMRHDSFASS